MTFIASFYNFSIDLNHADREVFKSFRLKTPRHESESYSHLYARMIAYLHSYQEALEFTLCPPDSKEPSIKRLNEIGEVKTWIQVGAPEKRNLELSLKQHPDAEHRVYFYLADDLSRFCHHLRGSKTNWVKDVAFYQIAPELLTELTELDRSSPHWNVSFIDEKIYLSVNYRDLESEIAPIDIWSAFQESLSPIAD